MLPKFRSVSLATIAAILLLVLLVPTGRVQGEIDYRPHLEETAWTGDQISYQGYLEEGGNPVNGTCDLRFSLWWNDPNGPVPQEQVGGTDTKANVPVTNGRFTVILNETSVFGPKAFTGLRWIEISVRCPAGSGGYTTLSPRQPLTPATYATSLLHLRVEPTDSTANILGGFSSAREGVVGGTISGGGTLGYWDGSLFIIAPNRVETDFSTVGGGQANTAGKRTGSVSAETHATVGGGFENGASAYYTTISGGRKNWATGWYAAIGGGNFNGATAYAATIPGGRNNEANGDRSFAAGRRAKAEHNGAFVWADNNNIDFASTGSNQFNARATGGFRLVSGINGSGTPTAGVRLNSGSGSWSSLSDRASKANYRVVDVQEILRLLSEIPITTWNYKAEDSAIRHMGPTAQDFYAAFGVGTDERHIETIDADGVALAAIQGLNSIIQQQEEQISGFKVRLEELEIRMAQVDGNSAPEKTAEPISNQWALLLLAAAGAYWVSRALWQFAIRLVMQKFRGGER